MGALMLYYKRPTRRRTYLSLLVRTHPVKCCGRLFSPALITYFPFCNYVLLPMQCMMPCTHSLLWLQFYADLQFSADPSYKHIFARETSDH